MSTVTVSRCFHFTQVFSETAHLSVVEGLRVLKASTPTLRTPSGCTYSLMTDDRGFVGDAANLQSAVYELPLACVGVPFE